MSLIECTYFSKLFDNAVNKVSGFQKLNQHYLFDATQILIRYIFKFFSY